MDRISAGEKRGYADNLCQDQQSRYKKEGHGEPSRYEEPSTPPCDPCHDNHLHPLSRLEHPVVPYHR